MSDAAYQAPADVDKFSQMTTVVQQSTVYRSQARKHGDGSFGGEVWDTSKRARTAAEPM